MLRYFIIRHDLPAIQTPHATPFKIRSAMPYKGKVIPFSHMYVTSDPYSRRIKKALGDDNSDKFEELNPAQKSAIESHSRFPVNFKSLGFKTVSELHNKVAKVIGDKDAVDIVVVNGIGTGYGDNYVGLGALQRLANLLSPYTVNFHLMQTMNSRVAETYMHEPNIFLHNNCMSMTQFYTHDFLINLTGMLGFEEFDARPLAQFQAHAFSIEHLIPKSSLHPKLKLDKHKINSLTLALNKAFNNQQKTILFHPKASSPLRTMSSTTATKLVSELIAQGYNVVSAFPYSNPTPGFKDLSKLSRSIDDLIHIVAVCDAVVSVGTVVYHLAAALNKPTLLMPTVRADVESASLLPEVLSWIPDENMIVNKHKSREEDDLEHVAKLWGKVTAQAAVSALSKHIDTFQPYPPTAPTKVAVVIPHFGDNATLSRCLDALIHVTGFDPSYLYVVNNNNNNRYFTVGVNHGIQQALEDGCDFVWVLNNDTEPHPNYINASLERFKQSKRIGIVGGKNLKTAQPDRIFWGGSYNAFPTGQHKAGYVSKNSLNKATRESWATFSSVMIRAETLRDVGLLDPSMRMIFSDSDYCFSAALKKWQTWYEPKAELLHDCGVSNNGASDELKNIFRADKRAFYRKWTNITGCNKPEYLQEAIWLKTGFVKNW